MNYSEKETPNKVALITGISGQDGSYLAEFLAAKNYSVHGIIRKNSANKFNFINEIANNNINKNKIFIHYGDCTDKLFITKLISTIKPNEIYNLAAQSNVSASFHLVEETAQVNAFGTLILLEAILNFDKNIKFYQASTSELFGNANESPQCEETSFNPRSPYGTSKLFSYWLTRNYRDNFKLFAVNGILYNHESPRRPIQFVSRKITNGIAKIHLNQQECLTLGNLNVLRDWGHAKDYVEVFIYYLLVEVKFMKIF